MFRIRSMKAAAVALGISLIIPAFADAAVTRNRPANRPAVRSAPSHVVANHVNRRPIVRNARVVRDVNVPVVRDVRFDRARDHVWLGAQPVCVTPTFLTGGVDMSVAACDVPACVMATVEAQGCGPIQSVELVRNGREFYRFIVASGAGHLDIRVGIDGRLLSIAAC